ncbi:MAG: PDGLE domain-containing protein, partial [Anaerolineales bacterium]
DLLNTQDAQSSSNVGWILVGGLISLGVVFLTPFASTSPDGLERVAQNLGFIHLSQTSPLSIFSNYIIPSVKNSNLSTILAGILGIIIVGSISFLLGKAIKKTSS